LEVRRVAKGLGMEEGSTKWTGALDKTLLRRWMSVRIFLELGR